MFQRLLKALKRHNDNESGFTILELLVVILIIGILAGVSIPIFLNQVKAANTAKLKSDVKSMAIVYATYGATNPYQLYPDYFKDWHNDSDTSAPSNLNRGVLDPYFQPSKNVTMHAFDIGSYFYTDKEIGQWFCIEASAPDSNYPGGSAAKRLIYSSKEGRFVTSCQP